MAPDDRAIPVSIAEAVNVAVELPCWVSYGPAVPPSYITAEECSIVPAVWAT